MKPTGCCKRDEKLLVEFGSRELCDRYLRITTALAEFYEYEWRQRWYGTDFDKEADLLGVLNDICKEIRALGDAF